MASNGDTAATAPGSPGDAPKQARSIQRIDPRQSSRPVLSFRDKYRRRAREAAMPAVALFFRGRPKLFAKCDPYITRSHKWYRDRKNGYNKALEGTIVDVRNEYGDTANVLDATADENERLRQLLAEHRVPSSPNPLVNGNDTHTNSLNASARPMQPMQTMSEGAANVVPANKDSTQRGGSFNPDQFGSLDEYDKAGVDLVLALVTLHVCMWSTA